MSGWWGCLLEVWGTNKKSGSAAHRAFGDEKGGSEEERLGRKLASGPPGRPVPWPWVACGKRERRRQGECWGCPCAGGGLAAGGTTTPSGGQLTVIRSGRTSGLWLGQLLMNHIHQRVPLTDWS